MNQKKNHGNGLVIFTAITLLCGMLLAGGYILYQKQRNATPTSANPTESTPSDSEPQTGASVHDPSLPPEPTQPEQPPLRDQPGHQPTVVLDAGHGFRDPGCAGPETDLGAYEAELTIEMVHTLKEALEKNGIRVLLTHDGKDFPSTSELAALCDEYGVEYDNTKSTWADDNTFSPYERVIYMNVLDAKYGVNFAFSVHVNANVDSDKLNGFDLDYCAENPWSEESAVYAQTLRSALNQAYPGRNLWYYEDSWEDSFVVTKYNTMPSALLETGYYTNRADAALLRDKNWRDGLMRTVCDAICEVLL